MKIKLSILLNLAVFLFFFFGAYYGYAQIEPYANPLFDDISTNEDSYDAKTGELLISQRQNDMTMLYGKLEGLSKQIQNLSKQVEQIQRKCGK